MLSYALLAGGACLAGYPAHAQDTPQYTGDLIIKWREDTPALRAVSPSARQARRLAVGQAAGATLEVKRTLSGGAELLQNGNASENPATIAARIAQDPRVEYAVPDRLLYPLTTPTDPLFSSQRNLQQPASVYGGANLPPAWDITTGSSDVVVAVVDTGYTDHPDLTGRVLPGYDFISNTFRANDGGGRDADASDPGDGLSQTTLRTAAALAAGCSTSHVGQSSWHGTQVASVLAASANNGVGIAGVSWKTQILPVRVLGRCSGTLSDILDGMRWAAGLSVPGVPANPYPARVINLSLGSLALCSAAEKAVISELTQAGVTVVAASGNAGGDNAVMAPANCPGALAIASHTDSGEVASYSTLGAEIVVTAPGGGCPRSQASGSTCATTRSTVLVDSNNGAYAVGTAITGVQASGTSFAAPTVAGVAALMLAAYPDITPEQIRTGLQQSARPHLSGTYCTTASATCGAGLLDAAGALAYARALAPASADTDTDSASSSTSDASQASSDTAASSSSGTSSLIDQAVAAVVSVVQTVVNWFLKLFGLS